MHNRSQRFILQPPLAFSIMVNEIPELATKKCVAISDDEFTATLEHHLKKAVRGCALMMSPF